MATLTSKQRDKLPAKDFAGPKRSYPVPDRAHAINAKARAKQQLQRGNITRTEYSHIIRMADEALGR
jgi:hypothetical protein